MELTSQQEATAAPQVEILPLAVQAEGDEPCGCGSAGEARVQFPVVRQILGEFRGGRVRLRRGPQPVFLLRKRQKVGKEVGLIEQDEASLQQQEPRIAFQPEDPEEPRLDLRDRHREYRVFARKHGLNEAAQDRLILAEGRITQERVRGAGIRTECGA